MRTDPKIVFLKDLFSLPLCVPSYQRPYTWSSKAASTLFWDVCEAFKSSVPEYRIGSVILFNNNGKYEIVDGQQRLTTLSILFYCLDKNIENGLLSQEYGRASKPAISTNFATLNQLCADFTDDEKVKLKEYALEHCSIVIVVAPSEQSAFQFFDSQNSRGKELAPHDLLKSYHLREMNEDSVTYKTSIINEWENTDQKLLACIFENSLYPLVRWYKGWGGLGYSSKEIDTFKGIQRNNGYNYSVYHRSANLYIEQVNQSNMYELLQNRKVCQFQLTQPLIAGKRFFAYTHHYVELYNTADNKIKFAFPELYRGNFEEGQKDRGDWLIYNLLVNVAIFFVDRFGEKELTESVLRSLFSWVYMLRISLYSVYEESVNKYALGKHAVNENVNMFSLISQMNQPKDLSSIPLAKPDGNKVASSEKDSYKKRLNRYIKIWNKYSGVKV